MDFFFTDRSFGNLIYGSVEVERILRLRNGSFNNPGLKRELRELYVEIDRREISYLKVYSPTLGELVERANIELLDLSESKRGSKLKPKKTKIEALDAREELYIGGETSQPLGSYFLTEFHAALATPRIAVLRMGNAEHLRRITEQIKGLDSQASTYKKHVVASTGS